MRSFFQETDSKIVFVFPYDQTYSFPHELVDETVGTRPYSPSVTHLQDPGLISSAWTTIRRNKDKELIERALNLLKLIQETITSFRQLGFDLGYLPPLRAFNVDDGSVLIEWTFDDFRIGFSIELNPEESGWYLVSSRALGEISASGRTHGIDIEARLLWLLNFILSST